MAQQSPTPPSTPPSTPRIRACVLAAGLSSRFGATKLVRKVRGRPLVQHALEAAQETCRGQVTLVVGHDAEAIQTAAAGLFDSVVTNEQYQDGIGSSIATGIRACRNSADAILVILGDQPLVTGEHLANIIAAWTGSESEIIATLFNDVSCPPILFPRGAFDALSALSGDLGAREVLKDELFEVRTVEFSPAQYDVDTPEDLQRIDRDS